MKKLNINDTGRMPLWQKDLDWMQRGYTEPIEALVAGMGLPMTHFIITGCSPYLTATGLIAMNQGWFCWGGKVLPVRKLRPTSVAGFANPVVRLTRVGYVHPDGARRFVRADLTTQQVANVWQDDYLQPSVVERSAAFTSGVRLGVGAWTLADIISHRNREGVSEWMPTTGHVQYKRAGRLVVLRGFLPAEAPCLGLPLPLVDPLVVSASAEDKYVALVGDTLTYYNGDTGTTPTTPTFIFTGQSYIAATPYLEPDTDPNTINDEPEA